MLSRFLFVAILLTACTTRVERTDRIMVPVSTSPCALGETCPDGTDVDPTHDHLDQWRALPCASACALLLRSPERVVDMGDDGGAFWMSDPGARNPETIDACEPIRWRGGAWTLSCTYPYDEPPPDELM